MVDQNQGQSGADRAVGRPGPVGRMAEAKTPTRNTVLIPPTGAQYPSNSPMPRTAASERKTGTAERHRGLNTTNGPKLEVEPPTSEPAGRVRTTLKSSLGPRSARLHIAHVDPWSVMKHAFLFSLALAVVMLIAAAALWYALDSIGVLDAITRTASDVGGEGGATVANLLQLGRVMGLGLVIAGVEIVLTTALATLFAVMYNASVLIGGGLEVTLSEDNS